MGVLVNFEDTYGIADIACKHFFNQVLEIERSTKQFDDIVVQRAIGTGNIFSTRSLTSEIDTIITVYDMDKQLASSKLDILEPEEVERKIQDMKVAYKGKKPLYVPVAFCAETICLHLLNDFSHTYSDIQ